MPRWILTCLFAVFLPGSSIAEAEKKPPNLIVFLTDQQRVDTLGAYGNTQIRTPTWIDWLSEASSSTPSMCPTRSAPPPGPVCSPAFTPTSTAPG